MSEASFVHSELDARFCPECGYAVGNCPTACSHSPPVRKASPPKPRVSWNLDWLMWAVVCPVCGPLPGYEQREDAEAEAREHRCEDAP